EYGRIDEPVGRKETPRLGDERQHARPATDHLAAGLQRQAVVEQPELRRGQPRQHDEEGEGCLSGPLHHRASFHHRTPLTLTALLTAATTLLRGAATRRTRTRRARSPAVALRHAA